MRRYANTASRLAIVGLAAGAWAVGCAAPEESAPATNGSMVAHEEPTAAPVHPELAHGKYMVDNVLLCMNCHSQRDWTLYSGPIVPGSEGRGGVVGIFGDETEAPDISPAALADWTDEQIVTAMIDGRDRDGNDIHAKWMLPNLAIMTSSDTLAVARYLRVADNPEIVPAPRDVETGEARGSYLVAVARCQLCHERDLSGGMEVSIPGQTSLLSSNITIDAASGVGRMNRTEFIDYFKSLSGPEFARVEVPPGTPNTAMAWPQFSQMTREDLGAIYDFIASRPAIHRVVPVH